MNVDKATISSIRRDVGSLVVIMPYHGRLPVLGKKPKNAKEQGPMNSHSAFDAGFDLELPVIYLK